MTTKTLENYNALMQIDKEIKENRARAIKKTGSFLYNCTLKPVGKLTKIAYKIASKGVKGIKKGISTTIDTLNNAEAYENLDSQSTYQTQPYVSQTHNIEDDSLQPGELTKDAVNNLYHAISNAFTYVKTKAKNAGQYNKLEKLASEISAKKGVKLSPEDVYNIYQEEARQKQVDEEIKKVHIYMGAYKIKEDIGENSSIETIREYNKTVDKANAHLFSYGITDPSKYFQKIIIVKEKK
ncbi:hypothetical protein KKH26_01910 [Patescibacteria group bacterium]|nr:hypothetical protein [Patescibacteria group bacterium]